MKDMVRKAFLARFSDFDFCLPNKGVPFRFLTLKRLPIERMNSRVDPFFDDCVDGFRSSLKTTEEVSLFTVVDIAEADMADMIVAGVPAFKDGSSGSSTVTSVVVAFSVSRSTVTAVSTLEITGVLVAIELLFIIC